MHLLSPEPPEAVWTASPGARRLSSARTTGGVDSPLDPRSVLPAARNDNTPQVGSSEPRQTPASIRRCVPRRAERIMDPRRFASARPRHSLLVEMCSGLQISTKFLMGRGGSGQPLRWAVRLEHRPSRSNSCWKLCLRRFPNSSVGFLRWETTKLGTCSTPSTHRC